MISICSIRCDPKPIKFGLTPQSPFQGFYIGHRVLLQPTGGGAPWILHEAFIVRLPGRLPSWAEPDYVAYNVAEFQRTGFHGGLNYYRAAEPYFYLSGAWKGAKITQPSFYIAGKADGLQDSIHPLEKLGANLPGLVGSLEIDNVGHWVQHEASAEISDRLVKFLRIVNPV